MSVRIAHLFPDSPFLAFTADVFDAAAPGANTFLMLGTEEALSRRSVPPAVHAEAVAPDVAGIAHIASVIRESDIAVFHSVGAFAAGILAAAPEDTLKVWSGWGGDYYGSDWSATAGLLEPFTAEWDRRRSTLRNRAATAYYLKRANRPLAAAARAADLFSAPIPNDLAVFRRRFRGFHGRYSQLNYASAEDTFAPSSSTVAGDDILLGNSATLANNHLDVLEALAQTGVAGRRVITPLSYGDAAYADAVAARGSELLGSDFVPLREFIPLREYQDIVAGCGVVVMGHRRQQGIGNIAVALWSGAHVMLDKRNPLTSFLRDRGATIDTFDHLASYGLPAERVTDAQREANRRMLRQFWGRDTVIANVRALVEQA